MDFAQTYIHWGNMFSLVGNKCCLHYIYIWSYMYVPPYLKSKSQAILLYGLQQSYVLYKKKTETLPIYFCITRWPLKWESVATIDNQMKVF